MKNAHLPMITIFLRFGVEKLALLCPDDSIQILLILPQFQTFRTDTGHPVRFFCLSREKVGFLAAVKSANALFVLCFYSFIFFNTHRLIYW